MKTAVCKFCGQVHATIDTEGLSDAKIEHLAAMNCECYQAREYRVRYERAEKAKVEIEKIATAVPSRNLQAIDDSTVNMLKSAVDLMFEDKIHKISIAVPYAGTINVKSTATGKYSVERSLTLKEKKEVE